MLRLTDIAKDYAAGDETVAALRGVSVQFRKNEFVAVLGPSGCGKTTLLNIIGGLDHYSEGDLSINGISTKLYGDSDWDAYRNHSVGFVFQSYNLIPHQTVLANVELALSISGVSKRERRARAIEALNKVGLGDQLKKRPNQMSGGQMQRVAIARALVNDPEILLADEPTGALDSETSEQVMQILKEVSKERLVIMVTHNPDLADRYATRIIRLLDGRMTDDTNPYDAGQSAELPQKQSKKKRTKRPSMSFLTALGLSGRNLLTKKGRTVLTSFAGSIGIIGIALIFAVSNGMTTYIDVVQEETLSNYPIVLEGNTVDLSSLIETFMGLNDGEELDHELDKVYSQSAMFEMINAINNIEMAHNDLAAFKTFVDEQLKNPESELSTALSGVKYTYNLNLQVYTKNVDGNIVCCDTTELLQEAFRRNGISLGGLANPQNTDAESMMSSASSMASMMTMGSASMSNLWSEILPGKDGSLINPLVEQQYDKIYGSWPNEANEVLLVLDKNNELDDMTLYALGLLSDEEIDALVTSANEGEQIEITRRSWTYEEICSRPYRVILPSDCYEISGGTVVDKRENEYSLKTLYENDGIDLKVVGVIRPKESATAAMISGSIAYTHALTDLVISKADESPYVQQQLNSPDRDIFTGLPFRDTAGALTEAEKAEGFRAYLKTLDTEGKLKAYATICAIPSEEYISAFVQNAMQSATRESMVETLVLAFLNSGVVDDDELEVYEQQLRAALADMTDEEITGYYGEALPMIAAATYASDPAVLAKLNAIQSDPVTALAEFEALHPTFTEEQCALYYDPVVEFSKSTYKSNLIRLGYVDPSVPNTINLYASSFENKDVVEKIIADYNKDKEDLSKITYTDYIGIMMSSISTIIDAITYVLIAFVSISLIVSSIMIAVITLISVQERTKEIGILRAIGASKRNVSGMFNAETMIIGFTSGLLGVAVTYLLCVPINMILHALTDIPNLNAILPPGVAVALVVISVILTLISGLIPSRSAAKKDPVVALRTE